jgi:FixJ family two-component response regulator
MSTAVEGMRMGAVSFLPKPVSRIPLVEALREALLKDASARTVSTERQRVRELLQSLTPRERQVLDLVARGLLNKQIAATLGTAEKTIKVHRGRLMHKMQVKSAAALVQLLSHGEPMGSMPAPHYSAGPALRA